MRKLFIQIVLAILFVFGLKAQIPLREINIKNFYADELLSIYSMSMEDIGQRFYGQVEVTQYSMFPANVEIQTAVRMIFDPVLKESTELLERPEKIKTLRPSQKEWMKRFQEIAQSGISDPEASVSGFLHERALMSSGKLYWCYTHTPLSETGKKMLQQILALERALDFRVFLQQAKQMSKTFEVQNDKMSHNFSAESNNIPMKAVTTDLGTVEIPDPKIQTNLIRKEELRKLKEWKYQYDLYMKNWQMYVPAYVKAADNVTKLLEYTGYGEKLTGADKQLISYLADLQCRSIDASSAIREVAGKIINVAVMAETTKKINQESISLLEPYIK